MYLSPAAILGGTTECIELHGKNYKKNHELTLINANYSKRFRQLFLPRNARKDFFTMKELKIMKGRTWKDGEKLVLFAD